MAMPLPFLPSEKRICDPRHHGMATAILTLANSLNAHIPGSRKRIADLEAILWTPVSGEFAGRYVRWSDSQRTKSKSMRNCVFSLMLHYAQLRENAQYLLPTETLTRRLQDDADTAAPGNRLRLEGEQVHLVHQASARYEGALGTWPSSYGISGLNPSNPVLAGAFDLLPSQPHSQNNVLNPLMQPQQPLAVAAPIPIIEAVDHLPPHGGAAAPNSRVIIVLHHPQVAPLSGGGGVVLAPPSTPNGGGRAAGGGQDYMHRHQTH